MHVDTCNILNRKPKNQRLRKEEIRTRLGHNRNHYINTPVHENDDRPSDCLLDQELDVRLRRSELEFQKDDYDYYELRLADAANAHRRFHKQEKMQQKLLDYGEYGP